MEENEQGIQASALTVIDQTTGGLSTWDIPRGPLMTSGYGLRVTGFLEHIVEEAKRTDCISMFFSPLEPIQGSRNSKSVTRNSSRHIHPEATRILDLRLSEEDLLAQMKQKGRYNIRLAQKHGVRVEESTDVEAFAVLMDETARRDGFRPAGSVSYRAFLSNMPQSFLLLAYAPQSSLDDKSPPQPIAGLIGAIWGTTGIYYYGASAYEHRALMAPFLLQWAAMDHCKKKGCTTYDLFGIAPKGNESHPWASVSEFKEKFGGTVIPYPPEREIVLKPLARSLLLLKRKIFR